MKRHRTLLVACLLTVGFAGPMVYAGWAAADVQGWRAVTTVEVHGTLGASPAAKVKAGKPTATPTPSKTAASSKAPGKKPASSSSTTPAATTSSTEPAGPTATPDPTNS